MAYFLNVRQAYITIAIDKNVKRCDIYSWLQEQGEIKKLRNNVDSEGYKFNSILGNEKMVLEVYDSIKGN